MGRLLLGLVVLAVLLGLVGVAGPQEPAVGRTTEPAAATAATAAQVARAKPDACGRRPAPKPSGRQWRCTFVDRFDGKRLDRRRWKSFRDKVPPGKDSTCRRPANARVQNGRLKLTVRRTGKRTGCLFTIGAVSTYHRFSQRYGRFEARVRVRKTTERGLHEAFWLWPDDRVKSTLKWPAAGEIDVAETYSQFPDLVVPFLHYTHNDNGGPKQGVNTSWKCEAKRGRWHRYTLLWGPDRIEIRVDGKRCLLNTSGDRAFRKRYIVAFTQSVGLRGNAPTSETPLPATMQVDYIKVWR